MTRKELCHNCGEHPIQGNAFGWCHMCIGAEYWGSADMCVHCGEESTADNPTHASVAEPPVSGYTADIQEYHDSCLSAAARAMVR